MIMRTHSVIRALGARAAFALLVVSGIAAAQQPNASPAATGLSGAYTALARGYDAVAWNPANLGMPGNPGFSISIAALTGSSGLDPISLSDFAPYSGKVLPNAQREQWLQTVTTAGGETGRFSGGLTGLALSAGPIALQVSTSVTGSSTMDADGFQAIMFGNAGRTGQPQTLNLQGSNLNVSGFTTAALSYGLSLGDAKSGNHFALGATAKYIVGNFMLKAQDQGSTATTDALTVNFPTIYSRPDSALNVGAGAGLDLGMAWSQDKLSFGATVQNVFNTFAWDATKLRAKQGAALFTNGSNTSNFDDVAYTSMPAALRAQVTADKFKPVVGAGIAYSGLPAMTVSVDARQQLGDGISFGPKSVLAGGVEFRGIPLLRLRGGAAYVTGGWGVSGGVGLALGGYELGVGAALRQIDGGKEPAVTINVLSIR